MSPTAPPGAPPPSQTPRPDGLHEPSWSHRLRRRVRTGLRRFVALHWFAARLLVALLGLAAVMSMTAWLALQFFIVPRIDEWRGTVERQATRALGVQVRIGQIAAQRDGLLPKVVLRNVRLIDEQGRDALSLPRVDVRLSGWALSPTSLVRLQLPLRYLDIHGPQLEVRRDARGQLFVAGLPVSGHGDGSTSGGADWLFSQSRVRVIDGQVRWIDEQRAAPPLDLQAVNLALRNGPSLAGRRHELEFTATPPAEWGQSITLKADFAQPLVDTRLFDPKVTSPTLTRPGDWRTWHGSIELDLPRADVQTLRRHLDLPFELSSGAGSVQASVEWADNQLRGAAATVHLRNVRLRLAAHLEALALTRLDGRVAAHFDDERASVQADNLSFATDEGWAWPQGDFSLAWRTPAVGAAERAASRVPGLRLDAITGGELQVRQLDLAALNRLADRMPISDALRQQLHEFDPRGQIETLSWQWDNAAGGPRRYTARGRVRGLTLAARPVPNEPTATGRPGIDRLDASFNASERGGQADVSVRNGSLTLPGVFDEPVLALREFDARLSWTITPAKQAGLPPRIEVRADRTRVVNDDVQGTLEATWATGDPTRHNGPATGAWLPGTLQLDATISQGRATSVARYLPTTIPHETRAYLQDAIQAGELSDVRFKINGDLWDVPFRKGMPGEFVIRGNVRNAQLDYVPARLLHADSGRPAPGWPAFTQLEGELVFDRDAMLIHRARARLGSVGSGRFEINNVEGHIDHLGHDATLVIDGLGKGPLPDALRLVQTTPLNGWTGHALGEASGDGPIDLSLGLTLRLTRIADSTVRGSVKLPGVSLRLIPEAPTMSNLRGKVDFTERGVTLQTTAGLLGGNATFDGGSQKDGSLRFVGTTSATADGLRRYTSQLAAVQGDSGNGGTPLERLATRLAGQTNARLALNIVHGQTEWQLTSNLAGLGLDLPAPFNKTADASLPLRVQLSPVANAGRDGARDPQRDAQRDVLRLEVGNLLQAQYLRDISGATARVLRGGIGVLQAARLPATAGVDAQITLPQFDADAWLAVLRPAEVNREGLRAPASGNATTGNAANDNRYLPDSLTLRTRELKLDDRRFSGVTLNLTRPGTTAGGGGAWRAQVDADQVRGQIELRPNTRAGSRLDDGTWRVQARLARLTVPASTPITPAVSALANPAAPATSTPTVPALDIVIDDLDWRGMKLGHVEIEADYRSGSGNASDSTGARFWRLSKFNISNPDAKLTATGQWGTSAADVLATPTAGAAPSRSSFDFKLDLVNAGNTLTRLGLAQTLRNGKGQLTGQLGWAGSPLSPAKGSLDGQMHINLEAGQFLRAEPGIAKLLGVLTLQSLPRRFLLDFRDVFAEGFAFDRVDGDVTLTRGVATTRNLRTKGVQALVLMEGQADLQHETQDLHVWIVPEINAGAASLAYAAINPVVGLGTFVAQYLLRKPLAEAG
ncbi:YhdP family protein, partial [Aquabacterium sp.]|uniref:YhdP family protein n=1 Tax=Aquabacterium sp. TaxID=1872578 RepID=UPI0035B0FC6E